MKRLLKGFVAKRVENAIFGWWEREKLKWIVDGVIEGVVRAQEKIKGGKP